MSTRMTDRNRRRLCLVSIVIGLFVMNCTPATQRLHPQFDDYRQPMGVMLLVAPQIDILEKMPDGSRIYREGLSLEARRTAQQAIASQLHARHFTVRTVADEALSTGEMLSILSLYRSVNRSIQLHTIGPQVFPGKQKAFEYHLGDVADMLDAYGADGLILALGHQTGIDRPDRNWLSIAVVEPQGRIIWYGIHGNHARFDIHSAAGMQALVACTLADFWTAGS